MKKYDIAIKKLENINKAIKFAEEWCADQKNGLTNRQICISTLRHIRRIITTN